MKLFNNLQAMWDYCHFCPLCQDYTRDINPTVGPEFKFKLINANKDKDILTLKCSYPKNNSKYCIEYIFNCDTDKFIINVEPLQLDVDEFCSLQEIAEAYFYFYIQSHCDKCDCSISYGSDVELDFKEKKVNLFPLERDVFWIEDTFHSYHITVLYYPNIMLISRYNRGDFVSRQNPERIKLPIVKFDFSDQSQIINKIKTLILFS